MLQDIPGNFLFSHLVQDSHLGEYFPYFLTIIGVQGEMIATKNICVFVCLPEDD